MTKGEEPENIYAIKNCTRVEQHIDIADKDVISNILYHRTCKKIDYLIVLPVHDMNSISAYRT